MRGKLPDGRAGRACRVPIGNKTTPCALDKVHLTTHAENEKAWLSSCTTHFVAVIEEQMQPGTLTSMSMCLLQH